MHPNFYPVVDVMTLASIGREGSEERNLRVQP
jgi:hypothetical protein